MGLGNAVGHLGVELEVFRFGWYIDGGEDCFVKSWTWEDGGLRKEFAVRT